MNLTDENILAIKKTIDESPISRSSMRENIIDHLCCAIEFKMTHGWDFEEALTEALFDLAPNGLREIEHETYLLLNLKNITMKKVKYLSGLVFCIAASVGLSFKIQKWPGANELLILGLGGLALIFVPLSLFVSNRVALQPLDRAKERLALISMALISIGGVLKVLHTAAANEALLLGTAVFALGFLPTFFLKMYRESVAG